MCPRRLRGTPGASGGSPALRGVPPRFRGRAHRRKMVCRMPRDDWLSSREDELAAWFMNFVRKVAEYQDRLDLRPVDVIGLAADGAVVQSAVEAVALAKARLPKEQPPPRRSRQGLVSLVLLQGASVRRVRRTSSW